MTNPTRHHLADFLAGIVAALFAIAGILAYTVFA